MRDLRDRYSNTLGQNRELRYGKWITLPSTKQCSSDPRPRLSSVGKNVSKEHLFDHLKPREWIFPESHYVVHSDLEIYWDWFARDRLMDRLIDFSFDGSFDWLSDWLAFRCVDPWFPSISFQTTISGCSLEANRADWSSRSCQWSSQTPIPPWILQYVFQVSFWKRALYFITAASPSHFLVDLYFFHTFIFIFRFWFQLIVFADDL